MSIQATTYLTLDQWVRLCAESSRLTSQPFGGWQICASPIRRYPPGFSDHDAYPDLIDKTAVLGRHLMNHHPLPDGNKRTAVVTLVVFIKGNGRTWTAPDHDAAVGTMLSVAARKLDPDGFATWIRAHTT